MGLSKRNPKGNFNWQTRYLKKKAICCGELNEPIVTNDCYHYFLFSDPNGFSGWTIDGQIIDPDNVFDYVMPSYGGFGNVYLDGPPAITIPSTCIIGYIDPTPPPTPVIIDNLGNVVPIEWISCCVQPSCLSITVPILDVLITFDTGLSGYVMNWTYQPGSIGFDPNDAIQVGQVNFFIRNLYGPQASVDAVYGSTTITFYIKNVYACGPISMSNKGGKSYLFADASCDAPLCYCYTLTPLIGTCDVDYVACNGEVSSVSITAPKSFSICAKEGSITSSCGPSELEIVGPNAACDGYEPVTPPTLGAISGDTNVCSYVASGGVANYYYFSFFTIPYSIPFYYEWDVPAGCTIVGSVTDASGNTFLNVTFDHSFVGGDIVLNAYFGCNSISTSKLTVSCAPCTYSAYFNPAAVSPYSNLTGWTLNGNPLITELTSLVTPLSGNVYDQFYDSSLGGYGVWFYYSNGDIGPLTFVAPDSSTYVVNLTSNDSDPFAGLSCTTVCYEVVMPTASEIVYFEVFNPYNPLACDLTSSAPVFGSIFSNDQPGLQTFFQLLYGPQVTVNVTSALGNDTITIIDAYDFTPPVLYDRVFSSYFGTYVPCP